MPCHSLCSLRTLIYLFRPSLCIPNMQAKLIISSFSLPWYPGHTLLLHLSPWIATVCLQLCLPIWTEKAYILLICVFGTWPSYEWMNEWMDRWIDEMEVLKMLLFWGIPLCYGAEASASKSLSYNTEVRSGFLRNSQNQESSAHPLWTFSKPSLSHV